MTEYARACPRLCAILVGLAIAGVSCGDGKGNGDTDPSTAEPASAASEAPNSQRARVTDAGERSSRDEPEARMRTGMQTGMQTEHDAAASAGSAGQTPQRTDPANEQDAGTADAEKAPPAGEPVEIRFRAGFGDQDWMCGRSYSDQGESGVSVVPQDLRFYVQEVDLITSSGESTRVQLDERSPWQTPDVALLDFEDSSAECYADSGTNKVITGHVKNGAYTGLEFVIGVPFELNHARPETLPAPLQVPGLSWNWLLGFRFFKLEVTASENEPDAGQSQSMLHLGSVGCSGNPTAGNIKCAKPNRSRITLKGFDPDNSVVALDLSVLLAEVDLAQGTPCHSAEAECEPLFRSLGIDFATGQPSGMQSAFHLE